MYVFPQSFSRRWSRRWTAPKSCASTSSRIPGISPAVFKRWRKPSLSPWMVSLFLTRLQVQFSCFHCARRRRQHTWNCPYSYLLESVIAPQHRLFQTASSADGCVKPCKLNNRRGFYPLQFHLFTMRISGFVIVGAQLQHTCTCWQPSRLKTTWPSWERWAAGHSPQSPNKQFGRSESFFFFFNLSL